MKMIKQRALEELLKLFSQEIVEEDRYMFFNKYIGEYGEILKELIASIGKSQEEIEQVSKKLVDFFIQEDIPFTVLHSTIIYLKEEAVDYFLEKKDIDMLEVVENGFRTIENSISLNFFQHNLVDFIVTNKERSQKLTAIFDPIFLDKYQKHIEWIIQLAEVFIKGNSFPILDPDHCVFGRWLEDEAKEIITDENQYEKILRIHRNLHLIANKIAYLYQKRKFSYTLLYYLFYKAEMLSISLGFEMALLSNLHFIKKAQKDELTGALNRTQMMKVLQNQVEIACAIGKSFTIILADIDFFKSINDTYGHIAGDYVLKSWAKLVRKILRKSDFLIRFGGEEFLIILPATTYQEAQIVAEKIRKATEKHLFIIDGQKIDVTASFGLYEVFCPRDKVDLEGFITEAIHKADQNLYMAKRLGRNRVI